VLAAGVQRLLVLAAETLQAARLEALRSHGAADVVLTARRAKTLKVQVYDSDLARLALPRDVDVGWVRALADPADDLERPLKGPFRARRGGDVALQRLAVDLCKAAHLLPAAVVVPLEGAVPEGLTVLQAEAVAPLMQVAPMLERVVSARVPLRAAQAARLHVFRPGDGSEEHYAVEVCQPARNAPVLARLHSACFTGDLLGSLKCDCGPQLNAALAQMGAEGAGVLLYLNQEGRGIGLANKMRAYALQDQGFDTVEANHRLGFEDDERDFRLGAAILRRLGFDAVRLLTNNPAKITMMEACGVSVRERVPLKVGETAQNARYLAVKAEKSGHLL